MGTAPGLNGPRRDGPRGDGTVGSPVPSGAMSELVTTEIRDGVAVIRIDDGKANAIGHDLIDALATAFDRAEADAAAVAVLGREGMFSAGFDLGVMRSGSAAAQELVGAGAELFLRIYGFPLPVVAGATGHALAAGAILLMSCDVRVGTAGSAKIGLPEVSLGMPLPVFGTELARDRLSKRHFTNATQLAAVYTPEEAVDVGFLDRVVPAEELEPTVMERAAALSALGGAGFVATRRNARAATIERIESTLAADLATFEVPAS